MSIIELPPGPLKGLDDFLCEHTIDEFKSLQCSEVVPLKARIEQATIEDIETLLAEIAKIRKPIEREALLGLVAKKFKIRKETLMQELSSGKGADGNTLTATFTGLIDIAEDEGGSVVFIVLQNGELIISDLHEIDKKAHVPPERVHIPFALPRAEQVLKYFAADDPELFNDIQTHLKQYSYLPDEQWLLISAYVHLTYIQDHTDIRYLPMLLFYADPERGKSRTGASISNISYRSIHTVELREVNLFRYAQNFRGTLFFDVKDLWKKAEKSGSEDILLLRYEKGAKCARVLFPELGAFRDTVYYDIYGASIIATNEALHRIIDSRCIPIAMPNKPGLYSKPTAEAGIELKARLTAWRAKVLDKSLPDIDYVPELSGRLWDISEPLLRVCRIVSPDSYDALKDVLISVAGQRRDEKLESIAGQIVKAIKELTEGKLHELYAYDLESKKVLDKLNESRPDDKKLSSQYLGRRIKALSLKTKRQASGMYIVINKREFDTLLDQYGLSETNISSPAPRENSTNYTHYKTNENSGSFSSVVSDVVSQSASETTLETTSENSKVSQGDNGADVGNVISAVSPEVTRADKLNIIADELGDDVEFIE